MKHFLIIVIASFCLSCKSVKHNIPAVLEFNEISYTKADNIAESDYIEFNIYLNVIKSFNRVIKLSELSLTCYIYGDDDLNLFTTPITSLKTLKPSIPVFVLENIKGKYKYYLDRNKFDEPIFYEGIYISSPIVKYLNDYNGLISLTDKKRYKKGRNFVGSIKIYTHDLKIEETDSIIRLHYLYKNSIVSSNWININP